jgi:tetratricopeptide (TPR) repeat protein
MSIRLVVDNTKNASVVHNALTLQSLEIKENHKSPIELAEYNLSAGNKLLRNPKLKDSPKDLLCCEKNFLKAQELLSSLKKSNMNSKYDHRLNDIKLCLLKTYHLMGFTEYCGNLANDISKLDSEGLNISKEIEQKTQKLSQGKDNDLYISEALCTVDKFSNHWASYSNLGMVYKYLGHYDDAYKNYLTADSIAPQNSIVNFGLGETILLKETQQKSHNSNYSKLGLKTAKKFLDNAYRLGYRSTDLFDYLGGIEQELGNTRGAIDFYMSALSLDGNNIKAVEDLYFSYAQLGDISDIDDLLEKASRQLSNDVNYWIGLANLFDMWDKNSDRVQECLTKASSINPKDSLVIAAYLKWEKSFKH